MSFLTSCFSCCFGGSGSGGRTENEGEKTGAEATRHARILSVYAAEGGTAGGGSPIMAPPPCYADIAHDRPVVFADSKRPMTGSEEDEGEGAGASAGGQHPVVIPTAAGTQVPVRRWSVSSRSSVVSVPSTRLSDLTSMYTGATRRGGTGGGLHHNSARGDNLSDTNGVASSWRSSRWYGSDVDEDGQVAPPSYYAGSTRSVSPIPTPSPMSPSLLAVPPPPALIHQHLHPVMQDGWFEGLWLDAERERDPRLHASGCVRPR